MPRSATPTSDLESQPSSPDSKAESTHQHGGDSGAEVIDAAEQSLADAAPSLPDEEVPPLPDEAPPDQTDDGWEPVWDQGNQAYYFFNRYTQATQWENPRVPESTVSSALGIGSHARKADDSSPTGTSSTTVKKVAGGYNPAIHGDYDPMADYALEAQAAAEEEREREAAAAAGFDPAMGYEATGQFNRFTGRWQAGSLGPDNYNDESKSRRQMHAFFDVDAAANNHDGRSLKAERSAKKLSKSELKMYQEKRRSKKEEKRRAWLRD